MALCGSECSMVCRAFLELEPHLVQIAPPCLMPGEVWRTSSNTRLVVPRLWPIPCNFGQPCAEFGEAPPPQQRPSSAAKSEQCWPNNDACWGQSGITRLRPRPHLTGTTLRAVSRRPLALGCNTTRCIPEIVCKPRSRTAIDERNAGGRGGQGACGGRRARGGRGSSFGAIPGPSLLAESPQRRSLGRSPQERRSRISRIRARNAIASNLCGTHLPNIPKPSTRAHRDIQNRLPRENKRREPIWVVLGHIDPRK